LTPKYLTIYLAICLTTIYTNCILPRITPDTARTVAGRTRMRTTIRTRRGSFTPNGNGTAKPGQEGVGAAAQVASGGGVNAAAASAAGMGAASWAMTGFRSAGG
jgi:hypothetical protein